MPPVFSFPTRRNLGSIPGVAAGALLTFDIPNRGTHYGAFLRARTAAGVALTVAQMSAEILTVTYRVNGEPKIELTAAELLMLQQYYGACDVANNVAGILPCFFYPRNLATWAEKRALAWGMADVQSFTVEIQLAAAIPNLAQLEFWTLSTDEQRNLGTHVMVRRFGQNYASLGQHEVTSLLKDNAAIAYKALHVQIPGASTITSVDVKADGLLVYDRVPTELNNVINQDGKLQVQAGWFPVVFDANSDLSGMLPMDGIKDFRPMITWATAAPNNYVILAEIYSGLKKA